MKWAHEARLGHIVQREALVENNSVLTPVVDQIRSLESEAEGLRPTRFDAIRAAFDQSVARLLA